MGCDSAGGEFGLLAVSRGIRHHDDERDDDGHEHVRRDAHDADVVVDLVAHGHREALAAAVGVECGEPLDVVVLEARPRVVLRARSVGAEGGGGGVEGGGSGVEGGGSGVEGGGGGVVGCWGG